MLRTLVGIAIIWSFGIWILSGLMHIWTVYIAYESSGWFWGIVSLFFPVIAQLVWGYKSYVIHGFDSPFIQWLMVLVIAWIFHFIVQFVLSIVGSRESNKQLASSVESMDIKINQSPIIFGFGGWLYLVAIGLILTFFRSTSYYFETLIPIYQSGNLPLITQESPMLGFAIIYESVFHMFYIVFPLLIGYLCYKQKKYFPYSVISLYVINLFSSIIYYFIMNAVPEIDEQTISDQFEEIIKSAVTCLIWIPYFLVSKRVKNTYNS